MDVRAWLEKAIADLETRVIPNAQASLHANEGALSAYRHLLKQVEQDAANQAIAKHREKKAKEHTNGQQVKTPSVDAKKAASVRPVA